MKNAPGPSCHGFRARVSAIAITVRTAASRLPDTHRPFLEQPYPASRTFEPFTEISTPDFAASTLSSRMPPGN
ncbi:hypothetical protein SAMN02745830_05325 [Streptomyces sp. Amel2xC10]|nr:hypothetical protein SAMN02745830_05325 [Streptomyces sp. Amel2xC10]